MALSAFLPGVIGHRVWCNEIVQQGLRCGPRRRAHEPQVSGPVADYFGSRKDVEMDLEGTKEAESWSAVANESRDRCCEMRG